jgi:hypothetical protein
MEIFPRIASGNAWDLPPPVGKGANPCRPACPDPVDEIVRLSGADDRVARLEELLPAHEQAEYPRFAVLQPFIEFRSIKRVDRSALHDLLVLVSAVEATSLSI